MGEIFRILMEHSDLNRRLAYRPNQGGWASAAFSVVLFVVWLVLVGSAIIGFFFA